jgi:hypothetical protein
VTDTTPVVLLAFANDPDEYLKNIRRERQGVFAALRAANDRRSINVYKEEETSTEQLFALFRDYADRVAIFHYGGHASGTGLRLEAVGGAAEQADAVGLAQLLGIQKGLQLVFLNGCATLRYPVVHPGHARPLHQVPCAVRTVNTIPMRR